MDGYLREPLTGERIPVRLAVTCDGGETYPAASAHPTVYWIKFLDATFTETAGAQTLTKYERTEDAVHKVYNLGTHYLSEGTVVAVFRHRSRWYTYHAGSRAIRCTAKAKGAIAAGTVAAPATGAVDNVAPIDGGITPVANSGTELTVKHFTAIAAEDDGDGIIEWDETNARWLFYPLACPAE